MAELKALSKLKMSGKLHYWRGTIEIGEYELHAICDEIQAEHEQAIAATLGSERSTYEQRIAGDGSDWGGIMRDAYDDLVANACESCTPEQMKQLADYIRDEMGSGMHPFTHPTKLTNAINELQKKQPYCYNPEQPLDTLNTIGRYIDELKKLIQDVWAAYNMKAESSFHPAWEVDSELARRMAALDLR